MIYNRKKIALGMGISLSLLAILAGIAWLYMAEHDHRPHENILAETPRYQERVKKSRIPLTVETVGTIMPALNSTLASEIPARIIEVYAHAGDHVEKDQLLAQLDEQSYRLEFEQAQSQWNGLKALFNEAENHFNRTQRLLNKEAATQVEFEKAKAAYQNAEAQLQAAANHMNFLKTRLEKTRILAPYAGTIGSKFIQPGDYAAPSTPLFALYSPNTFEIRAEVPQKWVPYLKIGNPVQIDVPGFKLQTTATLSEIIPFGHPQSYTFIIKARLEHRGDALPTSFAKMTFPVGEEEVLLIPANYFRHIGQLEIVSVLSQNKWERRYIRTGKLLQDHVIVLSGLVEGEIIGYD